MQQAEHIITFNCLINKFTLFAAAAVGAMTTISGSN